jgi:hypothetical protein
MSVGIKMVVGLDGIEKIIIALSPETMKETAYSCTGYINMGTYAKGKLVEWYKPINSVGEDGHTLEYLQLFSQNNNTKIKTFIRGPDIVPKAYKGLQEK